MAVLGTVIGRDEGGGGKEVLAAADFFFLSGENLFLIGGILFSPSPILCLPPRDGKANLAGPPLPPPRLK